MKTGFKKCPYCGKEIKDIAIKCQYCFKFLNQGSEKATKECPFCLNEIDINEKKCPYCDEVLVKENKIKKFFIKKQKDSKKIGSENNSKNHGTLGKFGRFLIVLYFLITIPIICAILIGLYNNNGIYINPFRIRNFYIFVFWVLLVILGYVILSDLLRRIASFISNGYFEGFLNYKKIFIDYWRYLIILSAVLAVFGVLGSVRNNKIENACKLEGEIIQKDLTCICDSANGYEMVDGKCEKSDFQKLDDAIVQYIINDKRISNTLNYRYYLDFQQVGDNEGIALFIDTSVPGGSNPIDIKDKYSDDWSCPTEVEGISKVVGQGYFVAYEKVGKSIIVNDVLKVPPFFDSRQGYDALPYPYLNMKQNNYTYYGGEKPTSEKDKELIEPSKIINLKDIDGDGKFLEFEIKNYVDQMCGTFNYLFLGYDDINKKIKQYFFERGNNSDTYEPRISLNAGSENEFIGGVLKQRHSGGSAHWGACDESWEYKYRKAGNYDYFDFQNYVKGECYY